MIVFCTCSFRKLIPEEAIHEVVGALEQSGRDYLLVDDLCRISAKDKEMLFGLSGCDVVACYSRAVKALFDAAGSKAGKVFNLRAKQSGEVLKQMELSFSEGHISAEIPQPQGEWEPWFPTIDRDRCTSCRKCMDYCLFGVYSWNGVDVQVANPANCKSNCPACARVCPQKAVIFPKYDKSPINGGLTQDEDPVNVDLRELYRKGDLYSKLAARNRNTNRLTDDDD